jgi:hypothetical protein
MTTIPLLTDIRAVLEATLHTYVGNRAGRDELVRVLRRMDDEALEQAEQRAHQRQYISAETRERLRLDALSRVEIDGVLSEF